MKKQINKVVSLLLLLIMCVLGACKDEKPQTVLELFSKSQSLSQQKEFNLNEDSLASIEGIVCEGENLVVYDFHSGKSYTLFDGHSGEYIARFGTIGQGPDEIPLGCYGYLSRKCFTVFNDQTRIVKRYSLDSLRNSKTDDAPVCLTKYDIPDTQISRLIAIDDSTFICAGTYQSYYQYLLFDRKNTVMDYGVDVYNAVDESFNTYTKFLSNQGDLIMHPEKKRFAYSVNFSSNIDFFEVTSNKIGLIKSLRLGDPLYKPVADGMLNYVDMTENTLVGYINLSATAKHVYALYSDKRMHGSDRNSNVVLVFDWEGKPVKKYSLDTEAFYIAVDEDRQSLFAAVKNSENGWSILCYSL